MSLVLIKCDAKREPKVHNVPYLQGSLPTADLWFVYIEHGF